MLHLVAMVAWFAGLFYIFRLFVYHVKHQAEPSTIAALTTMQHKLIKIIMTPSMIATVLFGTAMLVINPALFRQGWIHVKLLGVVGLIAYHLYAIRVHKQMAQGVFPLSEKACRMINEVPVLFLLSIVFLAVIKPF